MRLDILAEIDGKEKINIEMQNENEYNIVNRKNARRTMACILIGKLK